MRASERRQRFASLVFSRRALRLLALLALLAFLLATSLWSPSSAAPPCMARRVPRVVSHRGVDEDAVGPAPATARSVSALLDDGIGSFDVDLFWAADEYDNLFVGHPPTMRKLLRLEDELHAVPLATLRERARPLGGLLRLSELLRLLAARRAGEIGLVSLELKYPTHATWRRRLRVLYGQVAAAGIAARIAGVVLNADQAAAHRDAQRAAGVHGVPVLCVLQDLHAAIGLDGERHANLSELAVHAPAFDGWSASWRLLEAPLRSAATARSFPLAAWTVDSEAELHRCFVRGADDVVTNRPRWARKTLERWRHDECTSTHGHAHGTTT
jgi:glycerophosphoryl diester phosphodiesterase